MYNYQKGSIMKALKNALLATGLLVSTLGMSISANAGAIVTQDIFAEIFFAFPNPFGIEEGFQPIGSISYSVDDRDDAGFLDTDTTVLDLSVGNLALTLADEFNVADGFPVLAGTDPLQFLGGLEFFFGQFILFDEYELLLDVGPFSSMSLLLWNFDIDDYDVIGVAFLGDVQVVPEPSALILMLAGLGLLVRRKVAAK
jgi:hypothetical protein